MAPRDWYLLDNSDECSVPVVSLSTSSSTAPSEAVVALVVETYDVEAAMSSTASTAVNSKQQKVATLSAPARMNKKVTFHLVHVREYGRTVGDHPEVKVGPPIALSWQYVTKSPVLVEAYQIERELNGRGGARGNQVNRLTSIARKNLLLEYGYTEIDFRKAEVEVQLVREQRSMTKREVKGDTVSAMADGSSISVADHRDRPQRRRIGRSFRKNLMLSLSAAAKAMATPTMMAM
jgi:hypothetical protein